MPYFFRRTIESILITVVSSLPFYFLAKLRLVPSIVIFYILLFGLSAVVFLFLSDIVLREYLMAVDDYKIYLRTNLLLFAIQVILCFIGLKFFSSDMYTLFYGFTKPLRVFGVPASISALIFWVIHLVQILLYPVFRAKVRAEIKEIKRIEREERENTDL